VLALTLRVRAEGLEETLDRLLPLAPAGIYEKPGGPVAELVLLPGVTGPPDRDALAAGAGPALIEAAERELPDDPGERLALLLDPPVVAGRFVIRPPSAPAPTDPRLEDIVIDRGAAFGTGLHPTTRRCLELLLSLEPGGSFADLGCGTGVLAIGAAKLGFGPVLAVDYDERSVEAAARNAEANGVEVEARQMDLVAEPPPGATTVVANVPVHVHAAVRAALAETPRHLVVSGVTPADADTVAASYADLGLRERRRLVEADWAAALLTAEDVELRDPPREAGARIRVPPGPTAPAAAAPAADAPMTLPEQLVHELPDGTLALSSTRELPTGARVAVLLAPGSFRLDVRHLEDTLQLSVRNLSGEPILSRPGVGPPRTVLTTDDITIARPLATNARMQLRIGTGSQTREADVVLSALSGVDPGAGRIVAQAVVHPPHGLPEP
jgi:ribosomal protein L11 methyltransferase